MELLLLVVKPGGDVDNPTVVVDGELLLLVPGLDGVDDPAVRVGALSRGADHG